MLIKETDFNRYKQLEIISNTDNGLFAVQYEQSTKAEAPTMEPCNRWYYDKSSEHYTLTIPQPKQRNILRSVILSRTSTNHYEIAYADKLGCVHTSAKSLSAVHDVLEPLLARKFEQ